MKNTLLKFNDNKKYNEIEYRKGCIYLIENDEDYVKRWLRRGGEVVEEAEEVFKDLRLTNGKHVLIEAEKPEAQEPVKEEPAKEAVEEQVEEKKPVVKKQVRKKAAKK